MSVSTIWLSCGVLRTELQELYRLGKIYGKLLFVDSILHMNPQALESTLLLEIKSLKSDDKKIVIVYGDCCPYMLNIIQQYKIGRVDAINCAQMLVGKARYRELMRDEAMMILPEWALRWKEIFKLELGLTEEVAHDLMRENRGKLVYLDTGLVPVPEQILNECSNYIGLPLIIEEVTLDSLLDMLLTAENSTEPFVNERSYYDK